MGPLVARQHLDRVRSYVDLGVEEGAKLVVDGRGLKLQEYEEGFFLGGCLFDEVKPEMRIHIRASCAAEPDFNAGAGGRSARAPGWADEIEQYRFR